MQTRIALESISVNPIINFIIIMLVVSQVLKQHFAKLEEDGLVTRSDGIEGKRQITFLINLMQNTLNQYLAHKVSPICTLNVCCTLNTWSTADRGGASGSTWCRRWR